MERRPIKSAEATVAATNGGGEITAESPLCDRLAEIERRVSTALASDMTSSALANLSQQLGFAVIAADEFAKAEAERALDPTQCPDPVAARTAAESSAFMANRLKTMQPRLASHFQKVYAAEKVQTYLVKLRELAPLHNALQQELRATYEQVTGKLIDLFQRIREFERRVGQQLGNPPPNVDVLRPIDSLRVLDKVTLPDWSNLDRNLWPPPSNFAASYVLGMGIPQHPGPMWCDPSYQERVAAERQQERERMAAHYETRRKRPNSLKGRIELLPKILRPRSGEAKRQGGNEQEFRAVL